jgi:hypothetical protein
MLSATFRLYNLLSAHADWERFARMEGVCDHARVRCERYLSHCLRGNRLQGYLVNQGNRDMGGNIWLCIVLHQA